MMGERSTIIVYLITDALSILCIARLFRYYAAEKPLFLKELAAYAIYYLITNAVYLAFGIPILNMVMNLTGLSFAQMALLRVTFSSLSCEKRPSCLSLSRSSKT